MNLLPFIRKKELIDLTTRLVQIPTENPPGNEKAAAQFLKPLLSKMGFKTKTVLSPKGRWNIVAERRWGKGGRTLIFNGHLDVVPAGNPSQWKYPPFRGTLSKGRIYGRGASDMKSGIASFIHALSTIERSKMRLHQGAVVLHLVSDEESHGRQGMGFLTQKERIRGDAALVGEPTDLQPVITQKGALWLRISTLGKSAHGSRPHLGVNAVEKMMKLMERLNSIPLETEHPMLGKPTLNVGTIQGGTKINIVPDRCEIEVDRRMLPGEKKGEVIEKMKETLDSLLSRDPFFQYRMEEIDFAEPSEVNPEEEIVKIAVDAIQDVMGKKPSLRAFSGFTDSRFYINQCHIPTLIFGPGEVDQSHTTDESVEVEALVKAARIYGLILANHLSL
ncbi:MAG: M20 family metallopeptidase [Thermodesulfobacteriota bacterium]|jgi:acetylornithine deacetylase/succinyl-diaminopimelate desuccinylase family protein